MFVLKFKDELVRLFREDEEITWVREREKGKVLELSFLEIMTKTCTTFVWTVGYLTDVEISPILTALQKNGYALKSITTNPTDFTTKYVFVKDIEK